MPGSATVLASRWRRLPWMRFPMPQQRTPEPYRVAPASQRIFLPGMRLAHRPKGEDERARQAAGWRKWRCREAGRRCWCRPPGSEALVHHGSSQDFLARCAATADAAVMPMAGRRHRRDCISDAVRVRVMLAPHQNRPASSLWGVGRDGYPYDHVVSSRRAGSHREHVRPQRLTLIPAHHRLAVGPDRSGQREQDRV